MWWALYQAMIVAVGFFGAFIGTTYCVAIYSRSKGRVARGNYVTYESGTFYIGRRVDEESADTE